MMYIRVVGLDNQTVWRMDKKDRKEQWVDGTASLEEENSPLVVARGIWFIKGISRSGWRVPQ